MSNGVATYRDRVVERLRVGVAGYAESDVVRATEDVLAAGLDRADAVENGLAAGIELVGSLFDAGEYYALEVLMAADAMRAGLDVLGSSEHVDSCDELATPLARIAEIARAWSPGAADEGLAGRVARAAEAIRAARSGLVEDKPSLR